MGVTDLTSRERRELELRRDADRRLPFCPDHRDKVRGKPCRECEIERLSRRLEQLQRTNANPTPETFERLAEWAEDPSRSPWVGTFRDERYANSDVGSALRRIAAAYRASLREAS